MFSVSVCTYHLRIYYIIRYYATAVYSNFWRFVGQATGIMEYGSTPYVGMVMEKNGVPIQCV